MSVQASARTQSLTHTHIQINASKRETMTRWLLHLLHSDAPFALLELELLLHALSPHSH